MYQPFGWQDAPEGWEPGDSIPTGYEDSTINAENLEAFGAHILSQAKQVVFTEPGDPSPDPGDFQEGDMWIEVLA